MIRESGAIAEDCREADIVVAPFKLGQACKSPRVIVDRKALSAQGAHALFIDGLSIRTETVAEHRGRRPWSGHAAAVRSQTPDGGRDPKDRDVSSGE